MTTKQAYQPQVGDKVRVLAETSRVGLRINRDNPHTFAGDDEVCYGVKDDISGKFSAVNYGDIEPWDAPSQPQLPQGHVLLRDPSIGDVEREYREVRREAKVGELVKLVVITHAFNESHSGKFADGSVYPITHKDGVWVGLAEEGAWMRHDYSQYLVLEPTDIVWISDTRYQLAEAGRVAKVGEKVVVVAARWNHDYENGDVFEANESHGVGVVFHDRKGEENAMVHSEYRVLLPLTVESEIAAANHAAIVDDNHDFTALLALASGNMARHLEQARAIGHGEGWREAEETFKPTIAELERQLSIANGQLAEVCGLLDKERVNKKVPGTPITTEERARMHAVMEACRALGKRNAERRAQKRMTRDEVVEMAKGEVDSIVKSAAEDGEEITFRVNREFRTVVAELRIQGEATRSARAHATCAPDEVFNVHIGKVIAACRLVGSAVPAVYLNAPQPEKAQVGDVVVGRNSGAVYHLESRKSSFDGVYGRAFNHRKGDGYGVWVGEKQVTLIDDSRDGYVYDITRWRSSQQKYRTAQTKGGAAA